LLVKTFCFGFDRSVALDLHLAKDQGGGRGDLERWIVLERCRLERAYESGGLESRERERETEEEIFDRGQGGLMDISRAFCIGERV